jgi:hypothetical protein
MLLFVCLLINGAAAAGSAGGSDQVRVEEKLVLLSTPIPLLAYEFRPIILGPLPLVVMNETPWIARIRAGGVPKPRDATSKAVLIPIGPVSSKNQAHLKDKSSHQPHL